MVGATCRPMDRSISIIPGSATAKTRQRFGGHSRSATDRHRTWPAHAPVDLSAINNDRRFASMSAARADATKLHNRSKPHRRGRNQFPYPTRQNRHCRRRVRHRGPCRDIGGAGRPQTTRQVIRAGLWRSAQYAQRHAIHGDKNS